MEAVASFVRQREVAHHLACVLKCTWYCSMMAARWLQCCWGRGKMRTRQFQAKDSLLLECLVHSWSTLGQDLARLIGIRGLVAFPFSDESMSCIRTRPRLPTSTQARGQKAHLRASRVHARPHRPCTVCKRVHYADLCPYRSRGGLRSCRSSISQTLLTKDLGRSLKDG